jgi:peptidyl-prolyl cis-trans isomerase SurA
VEVQILTQTPRVDQEEINRIKDELREYTDRVNNGETTFQTLARMYSEDPGSARYGGELGFVGRGTLDPAFAAVAFNLTDPRKISKIVESEYGYHIIQLIDKRGDKVNVRHILRKPQISQEAIDKAMARLDSIGNDIREGKFTFDEGATVISDDKDTRNNHGLMANVTEDMRRTSKFRMQDLPPEIARIVDTLQVGGMSRPFQMISSRGKTVCAIVKLKSRVDGHKATITEDFQVMKDIVLNKRREECISDWIEKKIKTIYVRVNDRYRDCQFEHQGWIQ